MSRWASRLETAQHEAAHIVVGVSLGLRFAAARVYADGDSAGYAQFWAGPREAELICDAAGIAWERRVTGQLYRAAYDVRALRRAGVTGTARVRALELAAWAVLEARAALHAKVTRALLSGDALTARDLRAIVARATQRAAVSRTPRAGSR